MKIIRIIDSAFDAKAEREALEATGAGAVACFTGLVRGEGGLTSLTLDHYPAMSEKRLHEIADDCIARWSLLGVAIVHRVGRMIPGERIVFVGAASSHRQAALEACDYLIDWLKSSAPFWKKEVFADGSSGWVDARESDAHSLKRWLNKGSTNDPANNP
jgi:molybdopterin synthase catalytic subunit